jgi:hypothetical protein
MLRSILSASLFVLAGSLPVAGNAPPDSRPDWSKFVDHGEVVGEVIKCDQETVTLRQTARVPSGRRGTRTENVDTVFRYAEHGLARSEQMPPFFDDKGLRRSPTASERQALKLPQGAPGYAIERTDLRNGDLVKLKLVRPRSVRADKVTPDDLSIKYAIKIGEKTDPSRLPREPRK